MQYSKNYSTKKTPQNQQIPGKDQIKNNAGGFVFQIDKFKKLDRFLIIGTEGGSYYVKEKPLTIENANNVIECIKEDGERVVKRVIEISEVGRAPKNDTAIFSLALACTFGNEKTKKLAYDSIIKICRTGTHLFQFMQSIKDLRGFSRGLRNGIAKYYTDRSIDSLALQLVKYRQRNGWTHSDVLSLVHPTVKDEHMNELLRWTANNENRPANLDKLHPMVKAFEEIQKLVNDEKKAIELIIKYKLPLETIPTWLQKNPKVWEAVLPNLLFTAMIRNLGRMTASGFLKNNLQKDVKYICKILYDEEQIKKSRIHPLQILLALKTYELGRGFKGSLTWEPIQHIINALNKAFYYSFKNVEPTGKNFYLGIDVSGSMSTLINNTNLSNAEAAAAMAMVIARTESNYECRGFTSDIEMCDLRISPSMPLSEIVTRTDSHNFGNTDCSLPMIHAKKQKMDIDCFIILTDNETWAGSIHPCQALNDYRQFIGHDVKLIVAAFSSNDFSIADPSDSGMMDICGFDSSIPEIVRNFILL